MPLQHGLCLTLCRAALALLHMSIRPSNSSAWADKAPAPLLLSAGLQLLPGAATTSQSWTQPGHVQAQHSLVLNLTASMAGQAHLT